ncbi:MAG: hypothetical protein KDB79_16890 [Acidobacteria bacterium]|nr:hypothetical protein [Acidobacteriota bacterium]
MTTQEIIEQITSRKNLPVITAANAVISLGQERERIIPLIDHLPEIIKQTRDLNLGGAFAPNKRFVDFAIRTIEFHRDNSICPCTLYTEHGVDPNKEAEKGRVEISEIVRIEEKWVDYYVAGCRKCGTGFEIIERDWHFTWWGWKIREKEKHLEA